MRFSIVILVLATIFVVHAKDNNYDWGVKGDNDIVICNKTVSKKFFKGLEVKKKFIFTQKNYAEALTITAIQINDLNKKSLGATATLKSGGPGSKGATIQFVSAKGKSIKDQVIIFGR